MNRATVRRYTPRQLAPELLTQLLEEATHAPTTGNMQLYSIVVTTSAEGKRRLAPMHFNQPSVESAAAVVTFCVDLNRFVRWCEASDAVPGFDNVQMLLAGVLDAALVAQQFNTAAEMRGLGCCYLGTTAYNAPQIADALGLPYRVLPLITLTVGYPEGEPAEAGRLPLEAVVHYERYSDPSPEQVKRLYAEKEAREDSRGFVAENGKQTLAQVFADVRYPGAVNERFSEALLDYIRPFLGGKKE